MPERQASHGVLATTSHIVGCMLLAWAILTSIFTALGMTMINHALSQAGLPFPRVMATLPFAMTSIGLIWGRMRHSWHTMVAAYVLGGIACLASALRCLPMLMHLNALSALNNWVFMAALFLVQAVVVADAKSTH